MKIIWFILACLLVSSNASSQSDSVLEWPPKPDRPRVRFVESITARTLAKKESGFFSKMFSAVFGGQVEQHWLVQPVGIAISLKGLILVADPGAHGIHTIDRVKRDYEFYAETKNGAFRSPVGIAVSGDGVIYVSDSERKEIVVLDDDFDLKFNIRDNLMRPAGISIFGDKLYVTDTGKHKVVVFDLNGRYLYEFGERGDGRSTFNYPIAVNAVANGLYVVDAINYRVQHTQFTGTYLSQLGRQGGVAGSFSSPKSTAVDSDSNIYVTDALMDNFQIFSPRGELLLVVGRSGEGNGQFQSPGGIAIDAGNNIYVVDMLNRRVQVFQYLP